MTDSPSRLTLEVPAPWTRLQVGETGVPGIRVETDEHLRFYAAGPSRESDAVAQATGQLWLQAMNDVVALARRKLLVSSAGSTFVTANRGITVMAGFEPDPILSEQWPGEFPEGVKGYDTSAKIVGALSTGYVAALGVAAAAIKVTETVVGSQFTIWQSMSATVNVIGAGLNTAALAFEKDIALPGIQLWSQGGTLIGSTFSSVDVVGVGGVTLSAPFVSAIAVGSARLRGTKHAGLSSCGSIAVAGAFGGKVRAVLALTMSARTGSFTAFGTKRIECGVPNRRDRPYVPTVSLTVGGKTKTFPNPQQLTQVLTFQALEAVEVSAGTSLEMQGLTLTSTARATAITGASVVIGGQTCTITTTTVNPSIVLGGKLGSSKTEIRIDGTGLQVRFGGDVITCRDGSIELGAAAFNTVTVVPGASLTVNGTELALG